MDHRKVGGQTDGSLLGRVTCRLSGVLHRGPDGTLIAWAEELGHDDVARLLTTNLNEEKAAHTKLNSGALRRGVNKKASAA